MPENLLPSDLGGLPDAPTRQEFGEFMVVLGSLILVEHFPNRWSKRSGECFPPNGSNGLINFSDYSDQLGTYSRWGPKSKSDYDRNLSCIKFEVEATRYFRSAT